MRRILLLALLLITPCLAQPPGYDFVQYRGKVVRHPASDFPWKIYVSDHRYYDATLHALRAWNAVGYELGYPDIFAPVDNRIDADTVMDYSAEGLPGDKAAGVWWDFESDGARITRFVVDPNYAVPNGNRAQILLQELGHILGLDHSRDPGDIMFAVGDRRRRKNVSEARLSARDKEAFRWLYSQQQFLPIVSTSRSNGVNVQPSVGTTPTGTLSFDPIAVEITASVNVRLTFRNPGAGTVRAPMLLELWGRVRGSNEWRSLKAWTGIEKVPSQYKVSRDYFSELQPLFEGPFELMARVTRTDTSEILAERTYP